MKKNKHIGSSFENFLKNEGLFEKINVAAIKAVKVTINLINIPKPKNTNKIVSKK